MPSIEFRRLAVDDLQQVFLWLIRPHVANGYARAPGSFMECVAKFGPRTQEGSVVRAFVVRVDGADVGYAQCYDVSAFPDYARDVDCANGVACMDFFIGEESLLGNGLGPRVVDAFVKDVVFADPAIAACLAGPSEGNVQAIRVFEKVGFRRWKVLRPDDAEAECVMRRDRDPGSLRLAPIDLERNADACIAFRRDSFHASFGTHEGCDEEMGADGSRYLERLRARMAQVPEGNAHLWDGDRIVGQTEMRIADDGQGGYVNLFYLVPEWRSRGVGRLLHDHAVAVFRARGMRSIRLSVSRTNERAIAFYRRLGWKRVGFRPNKEKMEILELRL